MQQMPDERQERDEEFAINIYDIKKAGMILRSLNHKLRQDLIRLINQNKSVTVTELHTQLNIEQSVASQHLAILRKAGIVTILRQGKYKYYSINSVRLDQIKDFAKDLVA